MLVRTLPTRVLVDCLSLYPALFLAEFVEWLPCLITRTTAEINLRTIANLAGISSAQASPVLPKLVQLGLVQRREAPPSARFRLARENLGARFLDELAMLRSTAIGEVRASLTTWNR